MTQRILKSVSKFIKKGFELEELLVAKRKIRHEMMYVDDSMFNVVETLGRCLAHNIPFEDYMACRYTLESVTLSDVNNALIQIFDTDQFLTTYILPENQYEEEA